MSSTVSVPAGLFEISRWISERILAGEPEARLLEGAWERMAGMSRSLDQDTVFSSVFAAAAGPGRRALVSLGRYALRGVGRPQELFTLDYGQYRKGET